MKISQTHNTGSMWRHHFPRHQLLAACGISLSLILALSILPDSVVANRSSYLFQESDLAPPAPTLPATQISTLEVKDPWMHVTINKGDTLSSVLQDAGLSLSNVDAVIRNSKHSKELASLKLGDQLHLLVEDGIISQLQLEHSKLEKISVVKDGDSYRSELVTKKPEIRQNFATGKINSSLFLAGQKAGLDDRTTLKLADIFAYDIDFMLDIQEGDTFAVIYEDLYVDGEFVGKGKILAAEFVNSGKKYRAVQYTDSEGRSQYFSPEGETLRKQFLKTPVDFAQITSYFSLKRKHPILSTIRAHKGIDYAAPRGTPIRSAGDGKVVFAGVRNGFGNVVMIQHGGTYTTLYGHMDKIDVKHGAQVSQGQVIGKVGMTGLATGPHLHYEFHVNGVAQNPLANTNVAMAEPLNKKEKQRFANSTSPLILLMDKQLAAANKPQQLALSGAASGQSSKQ